MPIYEYVCPAGHKATQLRAFQERSNPLGCHECGEPMEYVISLPAKRTDGIYSYAPNIGSASRFERHRDAIKRGDKLVDGSFD